MPGPPLHGREPSGLDHIVHAVVSERRESGRDHGDLLSMLMAARDESGQGLSDTELRDQCMTIF